MNWNERYAMDKKQYYDAWGGAMDSREFEKAMGGGHNVDRLSDLDIYNLPTRLDDYKAAIHSGATPREAIEAHREGIPLISYAKARGPYVGASHEQILSMNRLGLDPNHYANARLAGASNDEVFDAFTKGCDMPRYAHSRTSGYDHNRAVNRTRQ